MDFFSHQEAARKQTGRLVVLFALAVAGIIAMVYVVALIAVGATSREPGVSGAGPAWWQPDVLTWVTLGVIAVVGVASLSKMAQLRGGGARVAESLGGRRVSHDTSDALEKRVLNVVEEMAIASGVPTPPVYVMDTERGINAFAAGWTPADAVIGVTRGCLETLDRDELQGVMAHEFSHILNGDMRLNIRLMGIVFGILALHVIGRLLLRFGFLSGRTSRNEKGGGAAAGLMFAGIALAAIGGIGAMFGSMIRASVSRQREFLADASAVQFTRNPEGIAGALKKIGGYSAHSRIVSPVAEEASHMFFSSAMLSGISGLFATHPPLPDRIRRIEPTWDGKFPQLAAREDDGRPRVGGIGAAGLVGGAPAPRPTSRPTNASAVEWIGRLGPAHVERARQIIAGAPGALVEAARSAFSARAVVFALVLDRDPRVREVQIARIRSAGEPGLVEETARVAPFAAQIGPESRGAIAEIAIGAMAGLSMSQWESFHTVLTGLVEADARRNVFEWMLERLVDGSLGARFESQGRGTAQYYGFQRLGGQCSMVLSILAHAGGAGGAGGRGTEEARRAFAAGAGALGDGALVTFIPAESCSLTALGAALNELRQVAPPLKRQLIMACARVVAADGKAEVAETELLRGVCAALGAPMPPVLPGQRLVG